MKRTTGETRRPHTRVAALATALLTFALLLVPTTARAGVECAPQTHTVTVTTAAELSAAITCFNQTFDAEHTIEIGNDISFTEAMPQIASSGSPSLVIEGGGHTIDAAGANAVFFANNAGLTVQDALLTGTVEGTAVTSTGSESFLFLNRVTLTGNAVRSNTAGSNFATVAVLGNGAIRNSTISGNDGAGILHTSEGTLTVVFTTITDNTRSGIQSSADVRNSQTTVIAGSIIAATSGFFDLSLDYGSGDDIRDPYDNSEGFNVLGAITEDTTAFDGTNSLVAVSDPGLAPLASIDGGLPVHALLPGSPAIDIVDAAISFTDQLGTSRPDFAGDAGSFEYVAPPATDVAQPGHAVAGNSSGVRVLAAVKESGALYTRTHNGDGGGWGSFVEHGARTWVSADVAVAEDGTVTLVGAKADGRLYTRIQTNGVWGPFQQHGLPTWSTSQAPAVSAANGTAAITAMKADGRLFTRVHVGGTWGAFKGHGLPTWANADTAMFEDGRLELVGVKQDGRLYTRSRATNGTWGPWRSHGQPTWNPERAASIAVSEGPNGDRVAYAATKADGRLFTRLHFQGTWLAYAGHGLPTWESAAVTMNGEGVVSLVAAKQDGRLYTRHSADGVSFGPFFQHGLPTWSTGANPSIDASGGPATYLAIKADGTIYTRIEGAGPLGWASYQRHGLSTWVP